LSIKRGSPSIRLTLKESFLQLATNAGKGGKKKVWDAMKGGNTNRKRRLAEGKSSLAK